MLASDRPVPASAVTAWTVQPVAIAVALLLVAAYAYGVRRAGGWPRFRTVLFGLGIVLLVWSSCGFLGAYGRSLFWVWTTQTLLLWLVTPIVLLFGHPLQLARAAGAGWVDRVLASRPVRVVSNPLVGPALVPILSFVVFFGPVPGWSIGVPVVGWLVQLALVVVGAAMALPLVGLDDDRTSSLAVGLALAIGMIELVIDAVPGIVMRLSEHLVSTFYDHRNVFAWSPDALHDQRVAGATVWVIAEIIDLPFLVLVYRRWLRVDAKDAAQVDAVLEAERSARGAERDEPWWLNDPAMAERLKRRE